MSLIPPLIPKYTLRAGDWLFIVPVFLLAFGLSVWGFAICGTEACRVASPGEAAYRTLRLLLGSGTFVYGRDPVQLVIAQLLLPLAAVVMAAKILLQNVRRDVRAAMAKRASGHVIVCGLGDTGRQVVESFRDAGWTVVAVTKDAESFEAKSVEKREVAVLEGDASQLAILNLAGLPRARILVITTGSDGANLEIALRVRPLMDKQRNARERLVVIPELRADWLYSAIVGHRGALLESSRTNIRPVHLQAVAAKSLLTAPAFHLSGEAHPRILFVGFNNLTVEIISQLVLNNFAAPGVRPAITILDGDPEKVGSMLLARHPNLRDLADVDVRPIGFSMDRGDQWPEVERLLADLAPAAVVVALPDDDLTLRISIEVRARLDAMGSVITPLFVQTPRQRELGEFLAAMEIDRSLGDRFTPFGDLAPLTAPAALLDPVGDALAKATHEGHPSMGRSVPWDQLTEPVKQSNRAFADHLPVKLKALGLRLAPGVGGGHVLTPEEIERLAMMEHWRWRTGRWAAGWRYGPQRDEYRRLHPDLTDWDKLGAASRESNLDMARAIPRIVEVAGRRIVRELSVTAAEAETVLKTPASRAEQLVIHADPQEPAAMTRCASAVRTHNARLRLTWRGSASWPPPVSQSETADILRGLEAWETPQEATQRESAPALTAVANA